MPCQRGPARRWWTGQGRSCGPPEGFFFGGLLLDGRVARQGEEDVVEGRSPEADVVDVDLRFIEVSQDLDERRRAAARGDREPPGVVVDGDLTVAVPREHVDRAGNVLPGADDDLD